MKTFAKVFLIFLSYINNLKCLAEEQIPKQFKDVDIEQKLGSTIFKDAQLVDEKGNSVKLSTLLEKKPTLLTFNYFTCTTLCSIQLNALAISLKETIKIRDPKEFQIITISIDPKDNYESASKRGTLYRKQVNNSDIDWKFLTTDESTINKITDSAGFYFKYDPKTKQYAHGAAVYGITTEGMISRYLFGLKYTPRDLSFSIIEASQGKIGSPVEKMILFCFHYDEFNGQYTPYAMNIMRIAGLFTVLSIGLWIGGQYFRDKKYVKNSNNASNV